MSDPKLWEIQIDRLSSTALYRVQLPVTPHRDEKGRIIENYSTSFLDENRNGRIDESEVSTHVLACNSQACYVSPSAEGRKAFLEALPVVNQRIAEFNVAAKLQQLAKHLSTLRFQDKVPATYVVRVGTSCPRDDKAFRPHEGTYSCDGYDIRIGNVRIQTNSTPVTTRNVLPTYIEWETHDVSLSIIMGATQCDNCIGISFHRHPVTVKASDVAELLEKTSQWLSLEATRFPLTP